MTSSNANRPTNWDALDLSEAEKKKWKPKELPCGDLDINLTQAALQVLHYSLKQLDADAFEAASAVLRGLLGVRLLWAAFQECEHVDGKDGVAVLMGVSRSRIYQLLKEFGLPQTALSDPNESEQSLALKSPKLIRALRELKKFDLGLYQM